MSHFPDTIVMHPDTRTSAKTCCEHYGVACGQGRQCPQRMAAEAATGVGADDPWHPPATRLGLLIIVLTFVAAAAGIAALWP